MKRKKKDSDYKLAIAVGIVNLATAVLTLVTKIVTWLTDQGKGRKPLPYSNYNQFASFWQ